VPIDTPIVVSGLVYMSRSPLWITHSHLIVTFSQAKCTIEVHTSLKRKFQGHRSTLLCALGFHGVGDLLLNL
jgi:hypothetical protein